MISRYSSHPCLSKSIDYYWIGGNINEVITMFPDGSGSIIFNLGKKAGLSDTRGQEVEYNNNLLLGPFTEPYSLHLEKCDRIIGIKFKQGGLHHLINKHIQPFCNNASILETVINDGIPQLIQMLSDAKKEEEIIKILNKYLFLKVSTKSKYSDIIEFALKELEISESNTNISLICEQLNISNKHLITLFKRMVGLTPKQIDRLNKFNGVLKLIQKPEQLNWSSIAFACNYYDQAHLINEFKSFSGWSPKQYLMRQTNPENMILLNTFTNI